MILIQGDIKDEIETYKQISPAARAIYQLLYNGADSDKMLEETIVYYERVVNNQREQLDAYIRKFGLLENKL